MAVGAVSKNRDRSLWDGFPSLVGALRRRGLRGAGPVFLNPSAPGPKSTIIDTLDQAVQ